MSLSESFRLSYSLLAKTEKRKYKLVVVAQTLTSLLDLCGVLLIGVVTALGFSAMSGTNPPVLVTSFINDFGLSAVPVVNLTLILAIFASLILIIKSFLNVAITRKAFRFLASRQAAIATRLSSQLFSQPLGFTQKRTSQETAYALTTGVNSATMEVLGQSIVALLVVLSAGLLFISPVVTLFTVTFFSGVLYFLHRLFSNWAGELGNRVSITDISSYETVQEGLRTYREMFVLNRRMNYVNDFSSMRREAAAVQGDLNFLSLVPKYVFEIALVIGAGLLAVSQILTRDLAAAVAVIAVFLVAGSRMVPSVLRLQGASFIMHSGAAKAAATIELAIALDQLEPTEFVITKNDPSCAQTDVIESTLESPNTFIPSVEIRNVSVTYPGTNVEAVVNINLQVDAGSTLALVGPTGSGKSTLADIILGVLKPDHGDVLIGGLAPSEAIRQWAGGIGYVPQEVVIARGTIRSNVGLGLNHQEIDDERVMDALDKAMLIPFFKSLPDGLDTPVGESGTRLSGGQRQRLGLARALYSQPKLLLLDEATSSLDAETEYSIAETLDKLQGQMTIVTIAHRLATVKSYQQVAYVNAGKLQGLGTFEEVRRQVFAFDEQARLLGL